MTKTAVKKMVEATYSNAKYFKIPDEIDLNADGVSWGVKWGTLYINLPDGREIEIECCGDVESDYKDPQNEIIIDRSDCCCDCGDDEEESDEDEDDEEGSGKEKED
jgi:hypothetical protein